MSNDRHITTAMHTRNNSQETDGVAQCPGKNLWSLPQECVQQHLRHWDPRHASRSKVTFAHVDTLKGLE